MALRAVVPAAPAAAPRSIHPSVLIPRLPLPNVPIGVFLAMAAPLPPGPCGTLRHRLAKTPSRGTAPGRKSVSYPAGLPKSLRGGRGAMGIGFVLRAAMVSLVAAGLLAFPAASSRMAVARADTTLSVVPDRAEPGSTVAVSGSCVEQSSSTTELVLEDQQGSAFESTSVTLDSDYAFSGAPFVIPVGTPPGQYRFVTGCEGRTPFTVVATRLVSPKLSLDRDSGRVGDNVSASGTCPTSSETVELFFDGLVVASATVDGSTGAFGPVGFPVPRVDAGSH